jgi:hypothetical protein
MNNCFTEACPGVAVYRSAYPGNKKAHHFKKSDLADLEAAYGGPLDGIRIWPALDSDGNFVFYAVGTIKDSAGNYNDVNGTNATIKLRPCPLMCGTLTFQ